MTPAAAVVNTALALALGLGPGGGARGRNAPNLTPNLAPILASRPEPTAPPRDVVARMLAQEQRLMTTLAGYHPRIETYIQALRPDRELGTRPAGDAYFLGRLDVDRADGKHAISDDLFTGGKLGSLAHVFVAAGFAGMITPDRTRFDTQHYTFAYRGSEYLGQVRCWVFDVTPQPGSANGSFVGRIWIEDQGETLVRFDGTYAPNLHHRYIHFDSWRADLGRGVWLPVAIYSQESDLRTGHFGHVAFKAQTRFWGYHLSVAGPPPLNADAAAGPTAGNEAVSPTPLGQQRAWELKAENDVLARMQQAGLLAPTGAVDAVLETVVHNLEATNHMAFDPPVRCRVLLTTPFESFTVGHTIVLSRGLIDVMPDEASLATVLAHELAHVALDHAINAEYAFDDRMMVPDDQLFRTIRLARTPEEEAAADARGMEILEHSPYRADLSQAGLFLEALQRAAPGLPNLLAPQWGNALVLKGRVERMHQLLLQAPKLQRKNLRQIPALPLAARVRLDSWSDALTLLAAPQVALLSARDKLSFEITPYLPYLVRPTAATAAEGEDATEGH